MTTPLSDLPTGLVVAVVILGLVQIALDIVALVDLYRRPADRVATGNKWVWVAVILLVNVLGAILYLVVGRKPAPVQALPSPAPSASRAADIADSLYGRPTDGTTGDRDAGPR